MASNTTISNVAALAICNAIVDLLDGGAGAGKVRIYDGAQPASSDVAVTTQVLLAELTLSDPAFGNAVDISPGARATANAITGDTAADATGTAAWFRGVDSDNTAVIDGSVGLTDADMIVSDVDLVLGEPVDVTSWTITQPETKPA